jgi:hypothetical protein
MQEERQLIKAVKKGITLWREFLLRVYIMTTARLWQ